MRIIYILLFLAFFSKSTAQGYLEVVNLSYDLIPLEIKDPAGNEHFNANNFKINDILPVFLKKDKSQYLLFGLNFESLSLTGTHPDLPFTNIYSLSPLLGYGRQVSKKLNLSALLIPLLNSDLYVLQSSDFHFGGVVRGAYSVNKKLIIKATLGYRQQFYGPQYIVFLGLDWKMSDKCRLYGDAPNNATLCYNLHPKMNAGVNFLSGNTSYHLTKQDLYLQYNFAQPGLFLEYYLTKMLAIRGTAAYSYLRNMDLYNMNTKVNGVVDYIVLGSQPTPLNTEVSNGFAFKLSLALRIQEHKN